MANQKQKRVPIRFAEEFEAIEQKIDELRPLLHDLSNQLYAAAMLQNNRFGAGHALTLPSRVLRRINRVVDQARGGIPMVVINCEE